MEKTKVKKKVTIEEPQEEKKASCPFSGLREYLQELYRTADGRDSADQEEGFYYRVEPIKRGPRCTWNRVCAWCGLPLLALGIVAVLIGQFTPPKEAVVGRVGGLALLDRAALAYNSRLEAVRLAGLGTLLAASLMILLAFLLAAYSQPHYRTSDTPPGFISRQHSSSPNIPISGVVTHVQPPPTLGP